MQSPRSLITNCPASPVITPSSLAKESVLKCSLEQIFPFVLQKKNEFCPLASEAQKVVYITSS